MPSEAPDRRSEGTGSLCDGLSGSVEQAPSTESDRGAGRDQQQADGNAQEAIVVDRGVPRVRAVPLAFQSLDPCVCSCECIAVGRLVAPQGIAMDMRAHRTTNPTSRSTPIPLAIRRRVSIVTFVLPRSILA